MIYGNDIKGEYKIEGNPRIVGIECKKILRGLYKKYRDLSDDPMYAKGWILTFLLDVFNETEDSVEWSTTLEEMLGYTE